MRRGTQIILTVVAVFALADTFDATYEATADDDITGKPGLELAAVCVDELCGYVSSRGQWQIPPRFAAADPFAQDGMACVITNDHNLDLIVKKDSNTWVTQKGFTLKPDTSHGVTTWVNNNGESHTFVSGFSQDALAIYTGKTEWSYPSHGPRKLHVPEQYGGRIGLIDTNGNFIDQPSRIKICGSKEQARIGSNGKWGIMDNTGQWLIAPKFEKPFRLSSHGVAAIEESGKWGIINTAGEWIIKPEIDYINSFDYSYNGLAKAANRGKWGVINTSGQWIIEPKFDKRESFSYEGFSGINIDGKWALIDPAGQQVTEAEFNGIWFDSKYNDIIMVSKNSKYGVINFEGKWQVKPEFDHLMIFSHTGLIRVRTGDKWGIINNLGQWVASPKFDHIFTFGGGQLQAAQINGKWGFLNTSGQLVIQPKLSSVAIPLRGVLASSWFKPPWIGVEDVRCYVDVASGIYRTGLNENPEEPGFSWDFAGGFRTLYNRRGDIVLTIDPTGEHEVATNAAGEVIWPLESTSLEH